MYAGTGLFSPYMHNFSQDFQQFEDSFKTQKPDASTNNSVRVSTISEYDLGGEADLFKAPEPIIEELGDISLMSQGLKAADVESIQNEQLLEVLYGCEKDMMAQAVTETPLPDVLDLVKTDENRYLLSEVHCDTDMSLPLQKSVSSGCLISMEWVQGAVIKPNFLDFTRTDFGSAFGMRRAFSEGDIQTLGNGNVSTIRSPPDRPIFLSSCSAEDRREKLSRYRNKKTKRNFGRKIKYACRKALADSQPRIRGRFAKIEECGNSERH
ncbi:hypothetical protein F3Y22_tig00111843pilonHSYRG00063 [Hibiscus syriacus]|uniref:CCT domain-containing protein n=1 Tax=Hibiscus syriacus TaxID=106335 RepID=A0A6A2Y795_HIBSY|nr:uncharacterized protein LOC120172143 isoform X1 [Hibiscus syriacus]KAE8672356.1 hypothetical protein F3Y22_tig00111843pilonHSYRG00063 [Hibiscus syriacus]